MGFNEEINIIFNAFVKSDTGLDKLKSSLKDASREISNLNVKMSELRMKMGQTASPVWKSRFKGMIDAQAQQKIEIQKSMGPMKQQIDQYVTARDVAGKKLRMEKLGNAELDKGAGKLLKAATNTKALTKAGWGLVGGMLGTMFFGMAVTNMLQGLIQPAAQATGIFDIWSTTLLVVFLPTMLALLPMLLQFMDFMMNLPESTQLALGALTMLGIVLGSIMMLLGQIGVFVAGGGFTALAAIWSTISSGVMAVVTALGSAFLPILAIVIAIIVGMVVAWQENWGRMREWIQVLVEGIKNIFGGLINFLGGILKAIITLFKGDTQGFLDGLKKAWDGLVQFLLGIVQFIAGLIVSIALGLGRAIVGILTVLGEIAIKIGTWAIELGKKVIDWLVQGIKNSGSAIYDALLSAFGWFKNLLTGKGGGGGAKATTGTTAQDFIWRSGQAPMAFSPNDNIVATKGGGSGVVINQTLNLNVADRYEIEKLIKMNNSKLVDDIKRMSSGVTI